MLPIHNFQIISGPSDLTIYHKGPSHTDKPLPAIFYFALSGEDSLCLDPFNQPVQFLGHSDVHVFSFTIPGHGIGLENKKAMEFWAQEIGNNHNIINEFIQKCIQNISFLIEREWIDPNHLAVAGLSRGGFVAMHLAAHEARIKTILGFAPLIGLVDLIEFEGLTTHSLTNTLSLEHLIPVLAAKQMRFYIGNRDERINTDRSYHFIRSLTENAYQQGIRSPQIELFITPSIGYKGHGTAPHIFKEGCEWIKNQLIII